MAFSACRAVIKALSLIALASVSAVVTPLTIVLPLLPSNAIPLKLISQNDNLNCYKG